jgi:hypothetical protein
VPAAEQEAGNGEAFEKMLALEPGLEFSLTALATVVPDCQYAGILFSHRYFAATTMISTL